MMTLRSVSIRLTMLLLAAGVLLPGGGCIELAALLNSRAGDDGGANGPDGGPGGGDMPGTDGGLGTDDIPVVRLTASNLTPAVGEEVVLTCEQSGGSGGTTFTIQSDPPRLPAAGAASTASFVVVESDVGQTYVFTCTGTNATGTSEPSNDQIVTPLPQDSE